MATIEEVARCVVRGARLQLRPQGVPVVALASTGIKGVMVMRAGGEFATVDAGRLAPWGGSVWPGPTLDWDALPLGLRLVVEYYEAKGLALEGGAALLSDRETAGLMIVTYGLASAATESIDAAGFTPAIVALLREAHSERVPE